MTGVLGRRGMLNIDAQRRPNKDREETRVTQLQAKDHQGLPGSPEAERFCAEPRRRKQPSRHPGVRLWALEPGENRFLLFKPPSLWYFITAASQKTQTIPKGLCGNFRTCPKILDMTANKRWKPHPQTPFPSAQTCDLHLRCWTGWK